MLGNAPQVHSNKSINQGWSRKRVPRLAILTLNRRKTNTSAHKKGLKTAVNCPQASYRVYRERDSNPHEQIAQRILSPLRLPIPPSRQGFDRKDKPFIKAKRKTTPFHQSKQREL